MKKSYRHDELSNVTCRIRGCHRKLKKRIVEQHPSHHVCHKCFKIMKAAGISTKRAKSSFSLGIPAKEVV